MIKRIKIKITSLLPTIGSLALMAVIVTLTAGCTHDPRTVRIDHDGTEGFDRPQELTNVQQQRVVGIILDTLEAKEQPPTESIYETRLTWTAIVWDNSHYSYMYSVGLDDVEAGLEYEAVPEEAAWYPGATLYYGDPQAPTAEWLIQACVDLDAEKTVYIISQPYSAAPLPPPAPEVSIPETDETYTPVSGTAEAATDNGAHHSEEAYLTVTLPNGWAVAEGPEYLGRAEEGQVAFNSWGGGGKVSGRARCAPAVLQPTVPQP